MSNRDPNEPLQIVPDNYQPKIGHIAREGEREFAAIMRCRSGISAGEIDFGVRVGYVSDLSEAEQRDIVSIAEAMVRSIRDACDKLPPRELTDWEKEANAACKAAARTPGQGV